MLQAGYRKDLHMIFLIAIPFVTFAILAIVNSAYYLVHDRHISRSGLWRITELWTILVAPSIFLGMFDLNQTNDCCTDSAVFAPGHSVGIYLLIVLCMAAYIYSSFRKRLASPVLEVINNSVLLLGLVLNVLIAIHINKSDMGTFLWLVGNVPVVMLFLYTLKKNNGLLANTLKEDNTGANSFSAKISFKILQAKDWERYPLLALVKLPLLLLVNLVLYLFGQKPDALIRAFTDTYKHGFSQLDYLCDNVHCGGHFLCSVAAKGHEKIVQPQRYGERNGHPIICNRQLLIANAFEELIQDYLPLVHKTIRRQYNKVGNMIHRYYTVFSNKMIADLVYFAMKPLEWIFLITIYTFDRRPEDRIARQYLGRDAIAKIKRMKLDDKF
ncbi:MAG TPA: DUF6688 family protein [Chitinophagaceae bacterium]|nr:DUF6688 family protein [Chitinophagaceae bacterium]